MKEYKELFISESLEILRSFSKNLVELEKEPSNTELLNEIFRQSHTLKGMAGNMGYERIVSLSHKMEDILDLLRAGKKKVNKDIIDLLFESVDMLEALVAAVRKDDGYNQEKIDVTPLLNRLDELAAGLPKVKKVIPRCSLVIPELGPGDLDEIMRKKQEGNFIYKVAVTLDKSCRMRQPRAFMIIKSLEGFGKIIKYEFLCDLLKTRDIECHFEFIFATKMPINEIKKRIEDVPEVVKVRVEVMDVEKGAPKEQAPTGQAAKKQEMAKAVEVPSIRVGLDRLDSLMDVVGELVINKIRLTNVSQDVDNKAIQEGISQMGRLTSELQTLMMQTRLVPLAYIFDRFPRMIRDLATEEKKEVDLEVTGSEIGMDRSILDEINDPLIHILRNAVSHGIEGPREREGLKKDRRGRISLSAHRERNFVFVEVSDDGMGIDPKKIREIAVTKKIMSPEEVNRLNDKEVLMLITTPGFTVVEKATTVSGRGVGMNAVRRKAESIGGSLSIDSAPGKSSRFILKLPLTMAIIQALIVGVSGETYCIPLSNIIETIKVSPSDIKTMEHHEVISYRETVLPLIILRERLGFGPALRGEKRIPVVVVEVGYKKAGLVVDKLLGQQEVVIKILSGVLKNIKGIAGATIMGSGKVAMIIDVPSLI